jgi:hypothetical protein
MKLSEQCDKIAAALVSIGDDVRFVGKSGNNSYDKYDYAKLDDFVRACAAAMKQHRVTVLASQPETVPCEDRTTKNGGKEHVVRVRVLMRALHTSGQWAEIEVWGEGQDRADKSVYKANTGARKYGYAMLFGLATSDDPEADESVGTAAPAAQRAVAPSMSADECKALLAKWTGIKEPKELQAAGVKCFSLAGVQLKPQTPPTVAQWSQLGAWINTQVKDGKDFITLAGGSK